MFQTRFRRSASGGGFAFGGQPVWACQCPVTNRTQAVARSRTVHSVTAPGVRGRGGLAGSQAAARSSPVCGLISAGAGSLPSSLARLLAGGHAQGGCWPAAPQQRSWLRCSSRGQSASKREVTFSSDALEVTSCPPFHHLVLRSKSRAVPYSERWGPLGGHRTVPPALPRVIPWWVRWTANGNAADWVDPEMSLQAGDLAAQP